VAFVSWRLVEPVGLLPTPHRALSPEGGTRIGRRGAATLDRVDDLKARAASADQERRERLNWRLRAAFIEGAEEDSVASSFAGPVRCYTNSRDANGDVPERREG
jgi:hypothetical protein